MGLTAHHHTMASIDEKNEAFAAALEALAIPSYENPHLAKAWIRNAKRGVYASGVLRPAFLGSYFRMTEQEWDALWALIYG